jgi:hypothetical protein
LFGYNFLGSLVLDALISGRRSEEDNMTRDEALDQWETCCGTLLDDAQKLSTQAKNPAARRAAQQRINPHLHALDDADHAT